MTQTIFLVLSDLAFCFQGQQYAHFIERTLRPPEEHAELPELIGKLCLICMLDPADYLV